MTASVEVNRPDTTLTVTVDGPTWGRRFVGDRLNRNPDGVIHEFTIGHEDAVALRNVLADAIEAHGLEPFPEAASLPGNPLDGFKLRWATDRMEQAETYGTPVAEVEALPVHEAKFKEGDWVRLTDEFVSLGMWVSSGTEGQVDYYGSEKNCVGTTEHGPLVCVSFEGQRDSVALFDTRLELVA